MKLLPKSIRWRLQLWYGLFLLLVLAGFGATAYQLERGRQMRRLDEDLQRQISEVAAAIGPPAPRGRPGGGLPPMDRPDRPPGPTDGVEGAPLSDPPSWDKERPGPPRQGPPDRLPGLATLLADVSRLPPRVAALMEGTDPNGSYVIIWGREGRELKRSPNAPALVPEPEPRMGPGGRPMRGPQIPRTRDGFREVGLLMPPGEAVLVGANLSFEIADLHRTAWWLAGTGGIILALGLAGGWWLATRAIRPIDEISATAVKIASGDLSQRINLAETQSELGRLANVLNSTFARLEAAFGQQRQFTSDAAHELRTPVTVLLTQTQTALRRERGAPEYRGTLEACQRAAQRMRSLIESLLELARLDAGQQDMRRSKFDLAELAAECMDQLRPLAATAQVALHGDLPPTHWEGDRDQLAQVITNLVTNAISHNEAGGEARIKLESQPGTVVLTVADDGPGILAEDLPRIFDRFYRADVSRSRGGAGLGLAIARSIVTAHGGVIEAAANQPCGAVFTVRLPVG